MSRDNFSDDQRDEIFRWNARRNIGTVDGIWVQEANIADQENGRVIWCENCKFCSTDRKFFDIDHLVPDKHFRDGTRGPSNVIINAIVLCKSLKLGDRGCNQTKGSRYWPPPRAGLAHTRKDEDMNCMPVHLRGANEQWPD